MIQEINGNILDVQADVICHQVNCRGVMGAGLAREIRTRYPDIMTEYRSTCMRGAENLGSVLYYKASQYDIANLFAQDDCGHYGNYTDYAALRACCERVAMDYNNGVVAVPYKLGCGLAGGDWNIVYPMLKSIFSEPNFHGTLLIVKLG